MTLRPCELERRASTAVQATGRKLSGYIARFNTEARIGPFTETIKRGAFRASLDSGRDILALLDHRPDCLLGRTKSGSLELREDSDGLAFSLTLPDTQAGRDLVALAERGDLGGCSFGFTVPSGGDEWDGDRRELRTVDLREVSVVQSWPAYEGTEIALRSKPKAYQMLIFGGDDTRRAWLDTVR